MTICKPLFIFLALASTSCFALQTYPLVDQESTHATISETEQNRIAVFGDRIQQIFGAEGTFDVQTDDEGGQIFLKLAPALQATPKASSWREVGVSMRKEGSPGLSKTITLTIITESGLTQDLKLTPKPIDAQSLLFKPAFHPQEEREVQKEGVSRLASLITLMKAMVGDEDLEGYTKLSYTKRDRVSLETPPSSALPLGISPFCPLSTGGLRDLKVDPHFIYKGDTFEGKIYILTNQGKTPLSLIEGDFSLKEDIALTLSHKTLLPQEKTKLYVISRLASENLASGRLASWRKL